MSTTIEFGDGGKQVQVATNKGWIDVADWADDLGSRANETYPELMHLIDHGESHDMAALVENIDNALANDPPDDDDVRETLAGLRAAVKQNEGEGYAVVSDGFESGY